MQEKKSKNICFRDRFGERLRNLRKQKGLSQTDLAKKLGYKQNGPVSNFESNKTPPDVRILTKIAEVLEADLHWLITGQPSPSKTEAVKQLMPFATAHLSEITQKIQGLQEERRDLEIRRANEGEHIRRLVEIQDELQNLHSYYKVVMEFIEKFDDPAGPPDIETKHCVLTQLLVSQK